MQTSVHRGRGAFRKGFTLIELMVVIGIILLLVSIVVFGLRHVNAMAARKETIAEMNICANMLKEYESVNGSTNGTGSMTIMNIEGNASTVPQIMVPDPKNPGQAPTIPVLTPVYVDAAPTATAPIPGPPPSYITIADLVGTSPSGDMGDRAIYSNSRYTAPAVSRTQAIMFVLLKDSKNRAMLSQVNPKRILEGTPDNNGVVTPFPVDYSVILDGWGNPIIFVPKGGMLVWMNPGSGGTNYLVRSSGQYLAKPDGTFQLAAPSTLNDVPFFASAGQDGIFTDPSSKVDNAIDNVYSFQQQ